MSKSYSTNLTQDQWELIEPLIPAPLPGGRPRDSDYGEAIGIKSYRQELFKHPLTVIALFHSQSSTNFDKITMVLVKLIPA